MDIKSFWEMNDGKLDTWLAEIGKGGKPELNRFSRNEISPLMLLVIWLGNLWPIVVSTVFIYIRRKRITKKPAFFVLSVLSGYIAMYAGYWILSYSTQKIIVDMENISNTTIFLAIYLPMGLALLLPVLALFVLARPFHQTVDR